MTKHDTIGDTGYSLDEVSAYFDRGRSPRIDAIEADAEAQSLLAAMQRVTHTGQAMLAEDERSIGAVDEHWYARLLETISLEVRAGSALPLERIDDDTTTTITEGALRDIARAAGDDVDGVLVGSVQMHRDDPLTGFELHVTVAVRYGLPLEPTGAIVRDAVHDALRHRAPAPVRTIDVEVVDLFVAEGADA